MRVTSEHASSQKIRKHSSRDYSKADIRRLIAMTLDSGLQYIRLRRESEIWLPCHA